MDKGDAVEILRSFRKSLEMAGVSVCRLVLFGSYATGKQTDASDIDVVVVSESFRGKNYWERIDLIAPAIYEVWKPIEAQPVTPEEWEDRSSPFVEFAETGEVII